MNFSNFRFYCVNLISKFLWNYIFEGFSKLLLNNIWNGKRSDKLEKRCRFKEIYETGWSPPPSLSWGKLSIWDKIPGKNQVLLISRLLKGGIIAPHPPPHYENVCNSAFFFLNNCRKIRNFSLCRKTFEHCHFPQNFPVRPRNVIENSIGPFSIGLQRFFKWSKKFTIWVYVAK